MRSTLAGVVTAAALGAVLATALSPAPARAASTVEEGKKVAFDRTKGNCLACHRMGDGELPGNIGPPLMAMQARYPDKAKLREQIWDATAKNVNSMMPPFGRHGILSEDEIDKIVDFVYTL